MTEVANLFRKLSEESPVGSNIDFSSSFFGRLFQKRFWEGLLCLPQIRLMAQIYNIIFPLISIMKLHSKNVAARRHIIIRSRMISKYSITEQMPVSIFNSRVMVFFLGSTCLDEEKDLPGCVTGQVFFFDLFHYSQQL